MLMFETIYLLSAVIVFYKIIGVIAHFDATSFVGHPIRLFGMAFHWALVGGGAAATVFGLSIGGGMLLAGLAMMYLSDRRDRRTK
jgi:hypothetical protein